jgi:hypothetical protein
MHAAAERSGRAAPGTPQSQRSTRATLACVADQFSPAARRKGTGSFSSQPVLSAARRAGGAGGVQPLRGARPSSAQRGALAAERALKARQAELPGLAVRGKGAPGARYAPPVGATESLRRTIGAQPPAVRNVAKGRASAAVAARLAHIDALLAKSKAAAGGARGYGECWPAPLGGAPPAVAQPERMPTPPAVAPSPMLMDELTGGDSDAEWAADWEVAEAMKGAEWAVADWESGRDLSAPEAEAEVEAEAEAEPEAAAEEPAAEEVAAAEDDPELTALATKMQAVHRGRAARAVAARLKVERDALGEIAEFSGALVEACMASAMQALVADENGLDD